MFDIDGKEVWSQKVYSATLREGDTCTLTLPKLHFKAEVVVDAEPQ